MMKNYNKQDPQSIQALFGSIAKKYDRANAILSLRMHKHWNEKLVNEVGIHLHSSTFLDLCCGTGDIAFSYLKKASSPKKAILVDFCAEMLACAQEKAEQLKLNQHHIKYLQADVQQIPLPDSHVSIATIAYGIRNVQNPERCFQEVHRILKPGGIFGILELTQPTQPMIKFGHRIYLRYLLPLLGNWVTSNREAYQYLCQSIQQFIPPSQLEKMLQQADFKHISRISLAGGIATILLARKI